MSIRLHVRSFLVLLFLLTVAGAQTPEALREAEWLLDRSRAAGGICVLVGGENAELAVAVAKLGPFLVHVLASSPEQRDALRSEILRRGLYGPVSVDLFTPGRLPYREKLVNLVVVESGVELPSAEALRVLAPLGMVAHRTETGWTETIKPWPAEIDEWGHYLHGADGNPVARDTVVGPPRRYQWLGEPRWQRSHETVSSVSTLVTAQGRLFYISDEAPISLTGQHSLPDKWCVVACDAFNGTVLWKVPIRRWGWREWRNSWFSARPGDIPLNVQKRLVAVGDHVYVTLGYRAPVSQLDARTGEILQTYADSEGANEILVLEGVVYFSQVEGDGLRIAAVAADSGRLLWRSARTYGGSVTDYIRWTEMHGGTEPVPLDPAANLATDGRRVALVEGAKVVALDAATGRELWTAPFPFDPGDERAGGIQAKDKTWVGSMILTADTVVHASPNQLAAFDASTGALLWQQPKRYIGHLWYEWKDVFVIDGLVWTWGPELEKGEYGKGDNVQRTLHPTFLKGYDLRTGEVRRSVPLGSTFQAHHHHRCYRNKATSRYVVASRRGSEYVDLAGGPHTIDNWIRGTCHVGMMPANGLQYAPPHPCQCYIEEKLNGMNAVGPDADTVPAPPDPAPVFEQGSAYGAVEMTPAGTDDWPTFRRDGQRSGACDTLLGAELALRWEIAVGSRPTPPVVANGLLLVADTDSHRVLCHDAASGEPRWQFVAGARVDSPPTYHEGRVIFGCTDGHVYCLRATDGALVWRFRAAPETRLMTAFGQLESVWPVHGSVLVQNGRVYFAAGRSSQLDGGLRVFALDPATGEVLARAELDGPFYTSDNVEQNFGLPQGRLPDILTGDGEQVFMRTAAFAADLKSVRGAPAQQVPGGYLDDSYFKRIPWRFGKDYGRLLVHNREVMACMRQFDSLRGLDPTVFFTPGDRGYLLFARNANAEGTAWQRRIRLRIMAMALTKGHLAVAGPPDEIPQDDPLGPYEGRKGARLHVLDVATGEDAAVFDLASPPVFNGIAAAAGRLYVVGGDGIVRCYGNP